MKINIILPAILIIVLSGSLAYGQNLDDFEFSGREDSVKYIVNDKIQFNG